VVKWFNTEVCKTSIHRFESGRRLHAHLADDLIECKDGAMDPRAAQPARSRRAVLTAAAAGAIGALAHALGRPDPMAAADGDAVIVGGAHDGSSETSISVDGATAAIHGTSESGPGVKGSGGTGVMGEGTSGGGGQIGVLGRVMGGYPDAMGVYGYTDSGIGVEGHTLTGTGVAGAGATGVAGVGGVGIAGQGASIGVRGVGNEVGVHAQAGTPGGLGLKVVGRAAFSLSGTLTIPAGKASGTSAGALPIHSGSVVVAVVKYGPGGAWVRKVRPFDGRFTVYLNKAFASPTIVSWIAFD
jgi:hypothetical protein